MLPFGIQVVDVVTAGRQEGATRTDDDGTPR